MEDQIRKIEIEFNNLEIKQWVSKIADVQMNAAMGDYEGAEIYLTLAPGISKSNLLPVHIVSLSCLVKQLQSCGCKCGKIRGEKILLSYLRDDLHLSDYFSSSVVHVEGESDYNLNLWKVSQPHSLMYSQYVSDYLRRKYFIDKDLSMLNVVLDELYSNIADHSKSEGVAIHL